tara:strand:+ start:235 stop:711 length:477 start_codon:yes stop_codon:yes gene_type:complete
MATEYTKQKIVDLTWKVHSLQTVYVAVHDDLFKFSLRKIIPIPGIFKPINFEKSEQKLGELIAALEKCKEEALDLEKEKLEQLEFLHMQLLVDFIHALNETLGLLLQVAGGLKKKATGFKGSDYSLGDYNQDLASYEKSVTEYRRIGVALNGSFSKIS